MAIPLTDFLDTYPPDTDMDLVEWRSEGVEALQCVLETSPWWVSGDRRNAIGRLVISMSGIVTSNVLLGWSKSWSFCETIPCSGRTEHTLRSSAMRRYAAAQRPRFSS